MSEKKNQSHRKTGDDKEETELLDNFRLYVAEGDQSFRKSQFAKAAAAYTRALGIQFDRSVLLYRSRCYIHLGKANEAITDADAAISDLNNVSSNETKANTFHTKADALYSHGDFEFALVFYYLALRCASNILTVRSRFEQYRLGIQRAENGILRGLRSTSSLCIADVVETLRKDVGEIMEGINSDKKCTARDLGIVDDDDDDEEKDDNANNDVEIDCNKKNAALDLVTLDDEDVQKQSSVTESDTNASGNYADLQDSSFKEKQFQMRYMESSADLLNNRSKESLQSPTPASIPNPEKNEFRLDECDDINNNDYNNAYDANNNNNIDNKGTDYNDHAGADDLPNQLQKMMYDMYGIDFINSIKEGKAVMNNDGISVLIAKIASNDDTCQKNESEKQREMQISLLCPLCSCPGCDVGICSDELCEIHATEESRDLIYDSVPVSETEGTQTVSRIQNYLASIGVKTDSYAHKSPTETVQSGDILQAVENQASAIINTANISSNNRNINIDVNISLDGPTAAAKKLNVEKKQDYDVQDETKTSESEKLTKVALELSTKNQQLVERIVNDILSVGICKCRCPACLRNIAYTYGFILAPDGATMIDAREATKGNIVLASDILETRVTEMVLSGVASNVFLNNQQHIATVSGEAMGTKHGKISSLKDHGSISPSGRRTPGLNTTGARSRLGTSSSMSTASQTPQFLQKDAEFLESLKNDSQLNKSFAGQKLASTIEEGLEYINKRTAFWSQQGYYQGSNAINEINNSNQAALNPNINDQAGRKSSAASTTALKGDGDKSIKDMAKQGNSGRKTTSSMGFSPSLSTHQTTIWRRSKDLSTNLETLEKQFNDIKKQTVSLHNIASKGVYGSDAVGAGSIAQSNAALLRSCSDTEYTVNQVLSICTKLNAAMDTEIQQWDAIYGDQNSVSSGIDINSPTFIAQCNKRLDLSKNSCATIEKALKMSSDFFVYCGAILTERQKYSAAIQKFRYSAAIYSGFIMDDESNNENNDNGKNNKNASSEEDMITIIRTKSNNLITKIHSYAVTRALSNAANIHQLINSYQDAVSCYNKILSVIDKNKEAFPVLYKTNILLKSTRCLLFINQSKKSEDDDGSENSSEDIALLNECKDNIVKTLISIFDDKSIYDNITNWIKNESINLPKYSVQSNPKETIIAFEKDQADSSRSRSSSEQEAEDLEMIINALFNFGFRNEDIVKKKFNEYTEVAEYEKILEEKKEFDEKSKEIIAQATTEGDALAIIQLSISQQRKREAEQQQNNLNIADDDSNKSYCNGIISIDAIKLRESIKSEKEQEDYLNSIFTKFENNVLTSEDEEYIAFTNEVPQYKCNKSVDSGSSNILETVTSREVLCDTLCLLARIMFQSDEKDDNVIKCLVLCELLAKRWKDTTALAATYLNLRVVYSDIITNFKLNEEELSEDKQQQLSNAIQLEKYFRQKCLDLQKKKN